MNSSASIMRMWPNRNSPIAYAAWPVWVRFWFIERWTGFPIRRAPIMEMFR